MFGVLGKADIERVRMIVRGSGVIFFMNTLNPSYEEVVNAVV